MGTTPFWAANPGRPGIRAGVSAVPSRRRIASWRRRRPQAPGVGKRFQHLPGLLAAGKPGVGGKVEDASFSARQHVRHVHGPQQPDGRLFVAALDAHPSRGPALDRLQTGPVAHAAHQIVNHSTVGSRGRMDLGRRRRPQRVRIGCISRRWPGCRRLLVGGHVCGPVMARLGHRRHHVLDLPGEAEPRAGRHQEHVPVAAGQDVFDHDGPGQPGGHRRAFADDPDPSRSGPQEDREARHQPDSAADLLDDLLVRLCVRGHLFGGGGLQQSAPVGRTAGQGQVTEAGPDFVPGHLAVEPVRKGGRAHGHRPDGLVATPVVGREHRVDLRIQGL
jgi:hypothetical protein